MCSDFRFLKGSLKPWKRLFLPFFLKSLRGVSSFFVAFSLDAHTRPAERLPGPLGPGERDLSGS